MIIIVESVSVGAGAIVKNWGAVRKCVRNNYRSAGVRAAHSKISSNPTSGIYHGMYACFHIPFSMLHSIPTSQPYTAKISLSFTNIHRFGILRHWYRFRHPPGPTRIWKGPIRTWKYCSIPLPRGVFYENLPRTRHLSVYGKWRLVTQGAPSLH